MFSSNIGRHSHQSDSGDTPHIKLPESEKLDEVPCVFLSDFFFFSDKVLFHPLFATLALE